MRDMKIMKHLQESRKLATMERYHTRFELRPSTVASHSWFVAKVTSHLCSIEKDILNNTELDEARALFMAINHDITEPYIGDIPTPVKDANPEIKRLLDDLETEVMENIISDLLPDQERDKYVDMTKEMRKRETIESKIVKAADIFDRLFECKEEVDLGNAQEFEGILTRDLTYLLSMKLESANILLKNIATPMGLWEYMTIETVAELTEEV